MVRSSVYPVHRPDHRLLSVGDVKTTATSGEQEPTLLLLGAYVVA